MSLTTSARNEAVNAIVIDSASLHSGFPGLTGANEISGNGYARKAVTFGSAASGVRSLSATTAFTTGAGHTVRWCGLWAGTVFKGYSPNGGSPKEFQVSGNSLRCPAHGYAADTPVAVYGGTVPTGLVEGQIYYVSSPTADTFQLSASPGGGVTAVGGTPGADCVVSRVVTDTYVSADTHTINNWSIGAVF